MENTLSQYDSHPRRKSSVGTENICVRCTKNIYPLELIGPIKALKYHKACFKCFSCGRVLELKTYKTNTIDLKDKNIYCIAHYPRNGYHGYIPADMLVPGDNNDRSNTKTTTTVSIMREKKSEDNQNSNEEVSKLSAHRETMSEDQRNTLVPEPVNDDDDSDVNEQGANDANNEISKEVVVNEEGEKIADIVKVENEEILVVKEMNDDYIDLKKDDEKNENQSQEEEKNDVGNNAFPEVITIKITNFDEEDDDRKKDELTHSNNDDFLNKEIEEKTIESQTVTSCLDEISLVESSIGDSLSINENNFDNDDFCKSHESLLDTSGNILNQTLNSNDLISMLNLLKKENIIGVDKKFGIIKLTLVYDDAKNQFIVKIHEAKYLKNLENSKKRLSNPYARIFLAKKGEDINENKKKTKLIKKCLDPKWEETFYFDLLYEDVKERELIVNLKHAKRLLDNTVSQFLGEVKISMKKIDLKHQFTSWYYLQPSKPALTKILSAGINQV